MTSVKDFTRRVFGTSKIMTAVAITMVIVGVTMSGMFVAGWASKQQKEAALQQRVAQPNSNAGGSSGVSPTNSQKLYTPGEVEQHSSVNDCWMIIDGSVYDVTNFLDQHPGGVAAMSPYCGKDGTEAFATMDGRGSGHSQSAAALKEEYRVGTIAN